MSQLPFQKHVADRLERRWTSRLAREALTWRSERPSLAAAQAIADRKRRIVSVTASGRRRPPRI